jgi:hypothetical protein
VIEELNKNLRNTIIKKEGKRLRIELLNEG